MPHFVSSMRRALHSTALTALVALAGVAWPGPHGAKAELLILQGSTNFNAILLEPYQAEVEAASGQTLNVVANKSSSGLQALLVHRADLAMLSTSLEEEVTILRQAGETPPADQLRSYEIARSRAVLVVHPVNPVRSVSFEDLRRILVGEVRNWRELGGPDLPIRVVAAREGGGVVTTIETRVLGSGKRMSAPDQVRVQNGPQTSQIVEQVAGAVGISGEQFMRGRAVAELVMPEPVELRLSLISFGEPTPAMQRVIDAFRSIAARL